MPSLTRLGLVAALLLSSIAAAPAPRSPSLHPESGPLVLAASPRGSSTPTEEILRQLGGQPCPDRSEFTCVTLHLPLDHFNPADTRTIPVTFAVLPASGWRKGMFVTVTGGPGTSGIASADSYTSAFDPDLPRRFDIVFFDQRGVALSGGLTCAAAAAAFSMADGRAKTPVQEAALKRASSTFSQDCVSEMGNPLSLRFLDAGDGLSHPGFEAAPQLHLGHAGAV